MFWKMLFVSMILSTTVFAANDPVEIPLWPSGAPGSEGKTAKEVDTDQVNNGVHTHRISSVHNPTITVYLPPKEKATGAAVIVCPGGGHRYLSIDLEGREVAKWFNNIGVTAFILKYRLANEEGSTYKVEVHTLQDGLRAVRMVRSRAQEWGVDPARLGMIGFSAGAHLTALVGTNYDKGNNSATDLVERQSSRPDFLILTYLALGPDNPNITADTPPTFLVHANDDRYGAERSAAFYLSLKKAGVSAELHIYAQGGHGFGMRDKGVPVSSWPARLQDWMTEIKLLQKR